MAALIRITSLLALVLGGLLWSAHALRADGEVNLSILAIDDSAFPTITVALTADAAGRPLGDLSPDAVRVLEGPGDGAEAQVISLVSKLDDETPLAVTLAIDVSGSMAGEPLDRAKEAARVLVTSLRDGDTAAVVTFASEVRWVQPHTTDRGLLLNALEVPTAAGYTALYDAVSEAASGQPLPQTTRSAVVLLSDGRDDGDFSQRSREEAIAAAAAGQSTFFTVGYGGDVDTTFLEEVAKASGGHFFVATSIEEIDEVYASIEALLRTSFLLTFESNAPASTTERTLLMVLNTAEGSGQAVRTYTSAHVAPTSAVTIPAQVVTSPSSTSLAPPPALESGRQWIAGVPATALILTVTGLVAVSIWRKRRRVAPTVSVDQRPFPTDLQERETDPTGRLIVGLPGQAIEFTNRPITIGTSIECDLRLPDAPGIASEHARVWMRDGRAMLHHLARSGTTEVNGASTEWAVLIAGDVIGIGHWELQVSRPQESSPVGDDDAPVYLPASRS